MSTSDEDAEKFKNDFGEESEGSSDDGTNGPVSMFSFLKPFHVPKAKMNENIQQKESLQAEDGDKDKATLKRKVPPPIAPKPKRNDRSLGEVKFNDSPGRDVSEGIKPSDSPERGLSEDLEPTDLPESDIKSKDSPEMDVKSTDSPEMDVKSTDSQDGDVYSNELPDRDVKPSDLPGRDVSGVDPNDTPGTGVSKKISQDSPVFEQDTKTLPALKPKPQIRRKPVLAELDAHITDTTNSEDTTETNFKDTYGSPGISGDATEALQKETERVEISIHQIDKEVTKNTMKSECTTVAVDMVRSTENEVDVLVASKTELGLQSNFSSYVMVDDDFEAESMNSTTERMLDKAEKETSSEQCSLTNGCNKISDTVIDCSNSSVNENEVKNDCNASDITEKHEERNLSTVDDSFVVLGKGSFNGDTYKSISSSISEDNFASQSSNSQGETNAGRDSSKDDLNDNALDLDSDEKEKNRAIKAENSLKTLSEDDSIFCKGRNSLSIREKIQMFDGQYKNEKHSEFSCTKECEKALQSPAESLNEEKNYTEKARGEVDLSIPSIEVEENAGKSEEHLQDDQGEDKQGEPSDLPPVLPPKSEKVYESMKSVSNEDSDQTYQQVPQYAQQYPPMYWYGQNTRPQMYTPNVHTSSPFSYAYQQSGQPLHHYMPQLMLINGQYQYVYPSMGYHPQQHNPAQHAHTTLPEVHLSPQAASGQEMPDLNLEKSHPKTSLKREPSPKPKHSDLPPEKRHLKTSVKRELSPQPELVKQRESRGKPKKPVRQSLNVTAPFDNFAAASKKVLKRARSLSPLPQQQKEEPDRECYIVVRNLKLGPNEGYDNLVNYIAAGTGAQPIEEKIIYQRSTSSALLVLCGKSDIEKLRRRCQEKPLHGEYVTVAAIEAPEGIAVSCEDDLAKEGLELYFEAPKSCGGPIKGEVEESDDQTFYIIRFEDPKVVQRVCDKHPHCFEGKTLRVSPYYEYEDGSIWDSDLHAVSMPSPVQVDVGRSHADYLQQHCMQELEDHLKGHNCSLSIQDSYVELTCTLQPGIEHFWRQLRDWPAAIHAAVQEFMTDRVTDKEMHVLDHAWNDLEQFLLSDDFDGSQIVYELNEESRRIKFTGSPATVIEKLNVAKEKHEQIDRVHRKKIRRKSFEPLELALPFVKEKIEQFKEQIADADIELSESTVEVRAVQEDIDQIYVSLYETLQQIEKQRVNHSYTKECVDFVNRKVAIKTNIDNRILNAGIEACWKLETKELVIYMKMGNCDIDLVCQIVFDIVEEQCVEFEEDDFFIFESTEWKDFQDELTELYDAEAIAGDVTMDGRKGSLLVFGLEATVKAIVKQIKHFIEEHSTRNKSVHCSPLHAKFLEVHCRQALQNLEREYGNEKLKINVGDAEIKLSGTKTGLEAAVKAVQQLLAKIIKKDHQIQKVAVVEVVADSQTIDEAEKETRCVIELQKEFEQLKRLVQSQHAVPVNLSLSEDGNTGEQATGFGQGTTGIRVTIVQGEIARQKADVLVAASSMTLKLGSGAAGRNMVQVGGESLQMECHKNYPKGIQHGDIAVINGGSMKCSKVYLTSLDNYKHGSSERMLQTVVTKCLKMASQHSKQSICFAAMGTGQLRYPARSVAKAMFQAAEDFKTKCPDTTLTDIRFVLHPKDRETIQAFTDQEHDVGQGRGASHWGRSASYQASPQDLTIGPMNVKLVVANIEKEKVDCVLVATNETMNLGQSGACKALLQAGGNGLQDECRAKYANGLGVGQIAEIGGGNLPCKSIFLTVLPSQKEQAEENLMDIMTTFLGLAQAKNFCSVALPALGTGYLRYPREVVCRSMYKALMNWANKNRKTCIQEVHFVMYSRDWETIQVFEKHFERLKRGSKKGRTLQTSHTQDTKAHVTNDSCRIGSISLTVQTGDILESRTDAIVSSCGKNFIFNGAVAKSMIKRCPGIEKECNKLKSKFSLKGIAVSKSHGLRAEHIIHVQFQETITSWKKIMIRCLEKAKKRNWKTIAFPVLGSGGGYKTFKPDCIAECLFDAIDEFTGKHGKTVLKDVRLVVFHKQPEMFKPILSAIQRKASGAPVTGKLEKVKGFFAGMMNYLIPDGSLMTETEREKMKRRVSSMSMTIYSDDMANIQKCIGILDEKLEKQYMERKIEDLADLVKGLKQEERKMLENIECLVDINIDPGSGIITVKGPVHHVSDAISELRELLRKIEKDRRYQEEADILNKQVKWYYEEITLEEAKLEEYDMLSSLRIETAFKNNQDSVELFDNDGTVYVIDFENLIEYVKGDLASQVKIVRKDVLKSGGAELPADWAVMGDDENVKIVPLQPSDPCYKDLEKRFLQEVNHGKYTHRIQFHLNTMKITKIEKIQNKSLYQQYVAKKKQIETQKPNLPKNMPIERVLWHGTKPDAASSIKTHGFNRSYCGVNGVWFGQGVYFAKDASYSARGWLSGADKAMSGQTATGCVLSVKALTGQYCKGNDQMRYLSPVDPKKPDVLYDSAVDNPANPFEFVIFTDTQSYPEFLIEFTATVK